MQLQLISTAYSKLKGIPARVAVQYEVAGLPDDEKAWIGLNARSWGYVRQRGGIHGEWRGNFKTAEEALAALTKEFD